MQTDTSTSRKASRLNLITSSDSAFSYLCSLFSYRELLWFFVLKEFLVKYKQTYFGLIWLLIKPIVTSALVFLIFQRLGGDLGPDDNYLLFVFVGISVWQFFSAAANEGALSLLYNTNLVTKSYFPRILLPMAKAIAGLFDIVLMTVLAIALAVYTSGLSFLSLDILLLVPAIALAFLSALAIAMIGSALSVRYRDLQYTFPFVFQVGFFVTPIVYAYDFLPEAYRWILLLNPVAVPIEISRMAFGFEIGFGFFELWMGLALIVLLCCLGLYLSAKSERVIADLI